MSDPPLARHAGPVALCAGTALAAVDVLRFALMTPDDRIGMLLDPVFRVVNAAYFLSFAGLVVALVALHGRQWWEAGRLGTAGFVAALVGTVAQAGDMWFEGFAAPWLAEVAPQVFTAERTAVLVTGALLSYVLVAAGWALYGLATLRARVLPVGIALALVVGGLCAFRSGLPPYGAPLGIAVAAVGGWLVRRDRLVRPPRAAATPPARRPR